MQAPLALRKYLPCMGKFHTVALKLDSTSLRLAPVPLSFKKVVPLLKRLILTHQKFIFKNNQLTIS